MPNKPMRFAVQVNREAVFPVITMIDTVSGCEAEIYAAGGLLNAFRLPLPGKGLQNLVDGFASPETFGTEITQGFKSAKLSPFVCRMRNGSYRLGKKEYTTGKWYLGRHAIHGLVYDAVFAITDTFASAEKAAVTLEHHYPGSDPGYPFPFTMLVNWQLTAGNRLSVATSIHHRHTEAIPIADGWHPYFTLGTPIDACTLQFDSSVQLEYDEDLLPTGNSFPDERFREGCLLKDIRLDNSFELAKDLAQPKCVLQNNRFRLTIEPGKSYPILQIYIPPHRNSIALENLSGAPDNFNNGIGLIMLPPGEQKVFRTSYEATLLETGNY